MEYSTTNNLVFIGASVLLNAEDDLSAKLQIEESLVSQDYLPFEIGVSPSSRVYTRAVTQAIINARCYFLLVGKNSPLLLQPFKKSVVDQELKIARDNDAQVYMFVHYSQQEAAEPWIEKYATDHKSWGEINELPNFVVQVLQDYAQHQAQGLRHDSYYTDAYHFKGFYYSAIHLEVRHYWLQIGKKAVDKRDGVDLFPVREWNFHDVYQLEDIGQDAYYSGLGHLHGGFLYANLSREHDHLTLNLSLGGSDELRRHEVMFGSLQGVTHVGTNSNFCYKTVVARAAAVHTDIGDPNVVQIQRILYLARKSFLSKHETVKYAVLLEMLLESRRRVDRARHVAGTYRVLTEGRSKRQEVVQSKMVIDENYNATIINPIIDKKRKLLCEIHFTDNIGKEKILFVMRDRTMGEVAGPIVGVAMLDFPLDADSIREELIGSFCSVGMTPGTPKVRSKSARQRQFEVRGGYFIARREDEKTDFEVGFIPCYQLIAENPEFRDVYDKLRRENGHDVYSNK